MLDTRAGARGEPVEQSDLSQMSQGGCIGHDEGWRSVAGHAKCGKGIGVSCCSHR